MSSFCIAKATHIFSAKNIIILYIESAKTVNGMTLNELVKLRHFEQLGPGVKYWSEVLCCTVLTHMCNIEVKVTEKKS